MEAKAAERNGTKTTEVKTPPDKTPVVPVVPDGPKSKQQRLAELLDAYKKDKISPADYHQQRAKILTEP